MSTSTSPRRPWYQFGLRTMFAVVMVVAVFIGYHVNWIRQRHEAFDRFPVRVQAYGTNRAPGVLWLFGEKRVDCLWCWSMSESEVDLVKRLFPEAAFSEFRGAIDDQPPTWFLELDRPK